MMSTGTKDRSGAPLRLRLPFVSVLITFASSLLWLWPDAIAKLAYVPDAVASGELWRLLTAHLVHFSFDHLGWDALTFLVVGTWCEMTNRRQMLLTILLAAVVIPPVVCWHQPHLSSYAGLSGLDVALYTLLFASLTRNRWPSAGWLERGGLVTLGGMWVTKVIYEFATGALWFVQSDAGDFVPVPLAHLVGGAMGLSVGLATKQRRAHRTRSPMIEMRRHPPPA